MNLEGLTPFHVGCSGDHEKILQYLIVSGQGSSGFEHSVPEQLFSAPDRLVDGISAVKALKVANDQGIPLHTINENNIDSILPLLQVDSDVVFDIQNAVNAGKEVTVSRTNIAYNGWTGSGYIIRDPNTGDGAYMISGGLSGSHTDVNENDKEFWGPFSTLFSIVGLKLAALGLIAPGSKLFQGVVAKIGIFSILVDLLLDIQRISTDDSLSGIEKYYSYVVMSSTAIFMILAIYAVIQSQLGPIAGYIVLTFMLFLLNAIEEFALEAIRESGG